MQREAVLSGDKRVSMVDSKREKERERENVCPWLWNERLDSLIKKTYGRVR